MALSIDTILLCVCPKCVRISTVTHLSVTLVVDVFLKSMHHGTSILTRLRLARVFSVVSAVFVAHIFIISPTMNSPIWFELLSETSHTLVARDCCIQCVHAVPGSPGGVGSLPSVFHRQPGGNNIASYELLLSRWIYYIICVYFIIHASVYIMVHAFVITTAWCSIMSNSSVFSLHPTLPLCHCARSQAHTFVRFASQFARR